MAMDLDALMATLKANGLALRSVDFTENGFNERVIRSFTCDSVPATETSAPIKQQEEQKPDAMEQFLRRKNMIPAATDG